MTVQNAITRQLHVSIAYFGPALSGRLTNLRYVYERTNPEARSTFGAVVEPFPLVAFYFTPLGLGEIAGHTLCVHLSAVPGHVFADEGRRQLLRNVDGIVFVADSQVERLEATIESLENLRILLAEHGRSVDSVPLVFQHNKCDLPNIVSSEELDQLLNPSRLPTVRAVAATGAGVFDTLKAITKQVLLALARDEAPSAPLVLLKQPDDPLRLWRLFRSDLGPAR